MELGTGRKTPSDYFLPLSDPSEASGDTNVENVQREDVMEIGELDVDHLDERDGDRETRNGIEQDPTERIEKAKSKLNSLLQSINEMYSCIPSQCCRI